MVAEAARKTVLGNSSKLCRCLPGCLSLVDRFEAESCNEFGGGGRCLRGRLGYSERLCGFLRAKRLQVRCFSDSAGFKSFG